MSKHTPGPWKVSGISLETGSVSVGHAEHRITIAEVTNAASFGDFINEALTRGTFGSPEMAATQMANARLIAAAPEMLEALTATDKVLQMAAGDGKRPSIRALNEILGSIRAVIDKAEGRS